MTIVTIVNSIVVGGTDAGGITVKGGTTADGITTEFITMGGTVIGGVVTGGVATSDSTVVVRPGPESKDFVKATYGTVIAGNIIHIENIFGGVDPPTGPLTIEITIFGI